jgi:FG-GAP repeat
VTYRLVHISAPARQRCALLGATLSLILACSALAASVSSALSPSPFVQQGAELEPSATSGSANAGASVALSADGNTALVGGPEDAGGTGAAWIFTRSGATWTQGPKLTSGGVENVSFGTSVALSADGETALVGSVNGAWIFTRSGSTWTRQPVLKARDEAGPSRFGTSVALSGDGSAALVGGSEDANDVGAAWIFTRSGSTWTQQAAKLTGGEEEGLGFFGTAVSLSGDGEVALIGGRDDGGAGAAWVFRRNGAGYSQQGAKLTGAGESGEGRFGASVALSLSGDTAVVGAPADNNAVGAAWVFTQSGSTWAQQGAKLTGEGESEPGHFGNSVALSADGGMALIGGEADGNVTLITGSFSFGGAGAAWLFGRSGATWTQQGTKLTVAAHSREAEFGKSVALSSTGGTALVGESEERNGVGAAWAFVNPALPPGAPFTAGGSSSSARHAPVLSKLSQSNRAWREGKHMAALARAGKRTPTGTTFSFTLNESARVTLSFTQPLAGRRLGARCVAQTPHNRRRRACERPVVRGSLSLGAHAGRNRVSFQGRLTRVHRLKPGRYTIVVTAVNAGGRSAPKSLTFTIVG